MEIQLANRSVVQPLGVLEDTKIDIHAGTLSMEFGDTNVKFNIFEALKHPTEDHSIFSIDAIDGRSTDSINSRKNVSPQPQTTELKSLSKHLKYAFLGDNQQFSYSKAQESNRLDTSRPSNDQLLHLHAQNPIGGGFSMG
ncbi:hypothetical protein CR513_07946, partial [Mucuna pruriens]